VIRRLLNRLGIGYVRLDGSEAMLWSQAARHAPLLYRLFRRSVAVADLDARLNDFREWQQLKTQLLPDDLIWPFTFNQGTLAMRQGFVVIRSGKPVAGLVTIVS
jgi:hypothetical protein